MLPTGAKVKERNKGGRRGGGGGVSTTAKVTAISGGYVERGKRRRQGTAKTRLRECCTYVEAPCEERFVISSHALVERTARRGRYWLFSLLPPLLLFRSAAPPTPTNAAGHISPYDVQWSQTALHWWCVGRLGIHHYAAAAGANPFVVLFTNETSTFHGGKCCERKSLVPMLQECQFRTAPYVRN